MPTSAEEDEQRLLYALGDFLRERRKQEGMTQEALSSRAKVARSTIARIEAGKPALAATYRRLTGPLNLPGLWYDRRAAATPSAVEEINEAGVAGVLVAQERLDPEVQQAVLALIRLWREPSSRETALREGRDLLARHPSGA